MTILHNHTLNVFPDKEEDFKFRDIHLFYVKHYVKQMIWNITFV